jgi:hypothetical protein
MGLSTCTFASVVALLLVSGHAFQVPQCVRAPVATMTTGAPPMTMTSTSQPLQMKNKYTDDEKSDDAPPLRRNPPRRICLMVEPTPFTHVSGYANRFKEMLKFMEKAGDEVDILTVDSKTPANELPKKAFGFPIRHTQGFTFPLYNQISLTFDLPEMKGAAIMEKFKPDLIHVTSP